MTTFTEALNLKLACTVTNNKEITTVDIPEGPKYLSEVLDVLPANAVINKGTTGCGGTTLELYTKRNSIIVVPTVNLIKNKLEQFEDDNIKLFGVYAGKDFSEASMIATLNRRTDKFVKVMVTYDSLPKALKAIRKPSDWFVLVDEWHVMFNAYNFKQSAVDKLCEALKHFDAVSYMTASPINREFIPTQLEGMRNYNLNWLNNKVCTVRQLPTNKPAHLSVELCKGFLSGEEFGNAHIFVNSVKNIASILSTLDTEEDITINAEDVKIVCSTSNKDNAKKIDSKFRECITSNTLEPKKLNFYTSTAFEGVDVYDEEGKIYIISQASNNTMRTDISTSFIQIVGRIRNSKYGLEITHIYSTVGKKSIASGIVSYDEYKATIETRVQETLKGIDIYNSLPEEAKEFTSFTTKATDFYDFDADAKVVTYNENKRRFGAYQHYLLSEVYKNGQKLSRSLMNHNFDVEEYEFISVSDKLKSSSTARVSFKEAFTEYKTLRDNKDAIGNYTERVELLEAKHKELADAYEFLTVEQLEKMSYRKASVKPAIKKAKTTHFKNASEAAYNNAILNAFKVGHVYKVSDMNNTINAICEGLDIKPKQASKVVKEFFPLSEAKAVKQDGKTVRVVTIK